MNKRINIQEFFERDMAAKMSGALDFVADVRRGVYKNVLSGKPSVQDVRSVDGALLGVSHVSKMVVDRVAASSANLATLRLERELTLLPFGLNLALCDSKLVLWAESMADRCSRIVNRCVGSVFDADRLGFSFVVKLFGSIAERLGVRYPVKGKCTESHKAALLRMCDSAWWRRQVRRLKCVRVDEIARSLRLVNARAQAYCSDEVVRLGRQRRRRNRSLLEGMVAENDDGQSYTLAELSDLSVSNPVVRKAELMVRMRGFEEVADELGHVGLFVTMTAPSRFHPAKQIFSMGKGRRRVVRVIDNDRYDGSTVHDAHMWMRKSWSRVRAAWDKEGIRTYGFRVVEPHADGCPHWHAILFFASDFEKERAMELISEKFLAEDGGELGAQKYRVKFVEIDKSKGSATGYIAKYISKNIDGVGIDGDSLGLEADSSAERILAWANAHGIRQFQQIGGPSVQVWRELRRLDADDGMGILAVAVRAADASDWAAYCLVMGGVFVERGSQPIRLGRWLETKVNYDTGEEVFLDKVVGRYYEQSVGSIFGVVVNGVGVLSRFYRWTVSRMGGALSSVAKGLGELVGVDFVDGEGGLPFTVLSDGDVEDLMRGCGF